MPFLWCQAHFSHFDSECVEIINSNVNSRIGTVNSQLKMCNVVFFLNPDNQCLYNLGQIIITGGRFCMPYKVGWGWEGIWSLHI